jgi:hypothetical protein
VVGARSLAEGKVELSERRDPRNRLQTPLADAVGKALELLAS